MVQRDKLVRDRIPEIIEAKGEHPVSRVLDYPEYDDELFRKGHEELDELRAAESLEGIIEEAADIIEMVKTVVENAGGTMEQVEAKRAQKAVERGGFGKRIFLISSD